MDEIKNITAFESEVTNFYKSLLRQYNGTMWRSQYNKNETILVKTISITFEQGSFVFLATTDGGEHILLSRLAAKWEKIPTKKCPKCGKIVSANKKFCGHCGTPLGVSQQSNNVNANSVSSSQKSSTSNHSTSTSVNRNVNNYLNKQSSISDADQDELRRRMRKALYDKIMKEYLDDLNED